MHLFHKWKVYKLDKYWDVSWGGREAYTVRIYKCQKCGKISTDRHFSHSSPLPGHAWEMEDFKD